MTSILSAWEVSQIVFWAGLEELIKAYLVTLFFDTRFRVPSYFMFFIGESVSKIPDVYQHAQYLGASGAIAVLGAALVIIGSTIFHVYTSILYAKTKHLYVAIAFCTVVHSIHNAGILYLPEFPLAWYLILPWVFGFAEGGVLYVYLIAERRMDASRLATGSH